ncbi:MAG TPA: glycerol-3-phosphate acyltransferase, partial [Thermomicrobiales bacterium]|nr:glycerol-3-phosphate acyltransferase [Thermomicrobiales bacterium]
VALFPWLLLLFPVMVVIIAVTRYVSLASIVAAALGLIASLVTAAAGHLPWWWAVGVSVIAVIIVYRHRSNISRLLSHTENKFGARVTTTAESPTTK